MVKKKSHVLCMILLTAILLSKDAVGSIYSKSAPIRSQARSSSASDDSNAATNTTSNDEDGISPAVEEESSEPEEKGSFIPKYVRIGLLFEMSFGTYEGLSQNAGLTYRSKRSLYGGFLEFPTFSNRLYFKLKGYVQGYTIQKDVPNLYSYGLGVSYAFDFGSRIQIKPGIGFSFFSVPDVQYHIDSFNSITTLNGTTKSYTAGLTLAVAYLISKDWYGLLELGVDRQLSSKGSIWNLNKPSDDISFNADIGVRGLWSWPIESGLLMGYRKLAVGQYVNDNSYSTGSLADFRIGIQLIYLLSTQSSSGKGRGRYHYHI